MRSLPFLAFYYSLASAIDGIQATPLVNEPTYSGNYRILHCTHSHIARLQILITATRHFIANAILDVDHGTTSTYGFASFFKTNSSQNAVREVFQNIANGSNVRVFPSGPNHPPEALQPTFACLNDGHAHTKPFYDSICTDGRNALAAAADETVVICPAFWQIHAVPSANSCPHVVNNQFTHEVPDIGSNQYGILVHELTHVYMPDTIVVGEAYDPQAAVELDAAASLRNPSNFALYACGQLVLRAILWCGSG